MRATELDSTDRRRDRRAIGGGTATTPGAGPVADHAEPIITVGGKPLNSASAPTEPILVTVKRLNELVGLSRSETYRLLAAGKLRAVKRGHGTLVLWASVQEYIATLPAATFRAAKVEK